MFGTSRRMSVVFLAAVISGITALHYLTEFRAHHYHVLYQGLYFLPIILAAFWFGLKGALLTSLSVTLLYLPFIFLTWRNFSATDFNNTVEIVLYNAFALILGALRDREKAERERLRESERLVVIGKAASGLAHDLKNPLIAIAGFSRLLKDHIHSDCPHREKLDIIIGEAQRMQNMTKEMLDFSGPLELKQSKENIRQVLDQSAAVVQHQAEAKKVSLQVNSSTEAIFVLIDSGRMKQVFINLLLNAIESSPEGGTVAVVIHPQHRKLLVDITDQGPGIPPDLREEIFSPFFTTKQEGTGLGLAIATKVIEAHHGKLEAWNNSERGATFRIVIPR